MKLFSLLTLQRTCILSDVCKTVFHNDSSEKLSFALQGKTQEQDDTLEAELDRLLYQKLMARANWFFTSLLCFGFAKDPESHCCFRLPPDVQWRFLVEVCSSHFRSNFGGVAMSWIEQNFVPALCCSLSGSVCLSVCFELKIQCPVAFQHT